MKILNYILDGFGFSGWTDFQISSFGFVTLKVAYLSTILAAMSTAISELFGISYLFFIAYVVLLVFEWLTGVGASFKRKEKHESRKLGRMMLKVSVYLVPLYILNAFQKEVLFPVVFGYEIDFFSWLYWIFLFVVIWQLFVSLLENLEHLNIRYASVLLRIVNKKFYEKFDIEEEGSKKPNRDKINE